MSNGQTKPLSPKLPFYLISVVLLCRIRTRITTTLMMGGKMTVIMPGKVTFSRLLLNLGIESSNESQISGLTRKRRETGKV